jgi:hypothetical protein
MHKGQQEDTVKGLREFADWLEQASIPEDTRLSAGPIYLFCDSTEGFSQTVKALGACSKSAEGSYLNATKSFGDIRLQATVEREKACKRIKTGTRIVEATPAFTVPSQEEHLEDIFEWECPPSFLKGSETNGN